MGRNVRNFKFGGVFVKDPTKVVGIKGPIGPVGKQGEPGPDMTREKLLETLQFVAIFKGITKEEYVKIVKLYDTKVLSNMNLAAKIIVAKAEKMMGED